MTENSPAPRHRARSRTARLLGAVTAAVLVVVTVALSPSASAAGTAVPAQAKAVLKVSPSPVGSILTDVKGRTVYLFMSDKKGVSTCTGQCLTYWPPVPAPASVPSSIPGVTGKLGSITRPDTGTRQLTINGQPLYTYAGDTRPGMISGQGSNGGGALWWVVAPSGRKITKPVPGAAS